MINIAEILRDCPKGTKLYSPLCGNCKLVSVINNYIKVEDKEYCLRGFLIDGRVTIGGECLLFPSKENRDWSTFRSPFNGGDIVASVDGNWIGITVGGARNEFIPTYCVLNPNELNVYLGKKETWVFNRFATEEEKQRLFDAIKAKGYKWNAETKTLEKLVPNKFDISTLKPFESRILVRDCDNQIWIPTFWGMYLDGTSNCRYQTINGCYKYCIPYECNEHLLGTTNDCDEYYKTWKI